MLTGCFVILFCFVSQVSGTGCKKEDVVNDPNGKMVFKPDSDNIPNDGRATLQCTTAGYQSTEREMHCTNGQWQGTLSTCQPAKCLKSRLSSPMENGAYVFVPDSADDLVQNGTLATVVCDKGYQMMKKTNNDDYYKEATFNNSQAFFCHFRVWVGRKASDLGYKCMKVPPVLLIGSILSEAEGGNTMELYDTEQPTNNKMLNTKLSESRFGHVTEVFDDGTVVIAEGKTNDKTHKSDTKLYNPKLDKIFPGPDMSESRAYAASVMVDNIMIVCGGFEGKTNTSLATCQILSYDKSTGQYEWKPFIVMSEVRYSHNMVEFNGNLIIIGGFRANNRTNNVEKYDATTKKWTDLAPMSTIRYQMATAKMGHFIYVCGGAYHLEIKTCEKYDTTSGNWSPVADMNTATVGFNLLIIRGKLYAFTGNSDKTVELYDPGDDKWNIIEPMKMARSYSKAVQLKPI